MAKKFPNSGIYMISWEQGEGYFYFGQSLNMRIRKSQHERSMRAGKHDNQILQRLYNKYGMPDFEIIMFCSPLKLNIEEQKLLTSFFKYPDCCNINPSATGSTGCKRSEETREKIRQAKTGKPLSEDHKKSLSIGLLRAFKNGRKQPKFYGADNHFYNKKHSDETRRKMSAHSKNVGASNGRARLVLDLSTGIFYDHAGEAAEAKNLNPQYLRRVLNGDRKNKTSFIYA